MKSFDELLLRKNKGSLKIYLGYAAGVGKTFDMLMEGQTLKSRGFDVVIGYVEPHDRPDTTALVPGLEVVPRQMVGVGDKAALPEMDLEGVLARRADIVLVDELAHTNAEGSKNPKRYMDVLELLDHGMNVITTLNVQHLESVADRVEQATGVPVQERLPDAVLHRADQVVTVDVSMEELRERLRLGKIYPPERAEAALRNFFTHQNLAFLRETCLRETAGDQNRKSEELGLNALQSGGGGGAEEAVMVVLTSRMSDAQSLLRKASRIAGQFSSRLYAVYVQRRAEDPTNIEASVQRELLRSFQAAKQLGAEVVTLTGENASDVLVDFAIEKRVAHAVFPRPKDPPLLQRVKGSVLLDFIFDSIGVDIHVVNTETKERRR